MSTMPALSLSERSELARCEAVIERGLTTFVEVGQALMSIRDARLYRIEHGTFEDYCRARWNIDRTYAHRLIDAAVVVANVAHGQQFCAPQTERQARPLSKLAPEDQSDAWKEAVRTAPNGKPTSKHVEEVVNNRLSVHFSSKTPEHLTPPEIIEAAVRCMGVIDLDPCSETRISPNVSARAHFTIEDDGLAHIWTGRVYMNPPYGRTIGDWTEKLVLEYDGGRVREAIALLPARTDTAWFRAMSRFPVCFISGRLTFLNNEGAAPFPSAVFYLGARENDFFTGFCSLGDIWKRIR